MVDPAEVSIDFNTEIDRTVVGALKHDPKIMASLFGRSDLWPSWVADMDFKASRSVEEALVRRAAHGVFGYESENPQLPAAVANWYAKRHGWQFDPDHLLFSPRTLTSLALLVDRFSEKGEGVIVQPPVFYDFKLIVNSNGRRLVKNPLKLEQGIYRMGFDHLERVAAVPENRLLILCNPHNPVGRVWSKQELLRLSEICAANGVYVVADEIHGDITYGQGYTPLASASTEASLNRATCISPVKSFNLAGVANSMIVIEDEERRSRCREWFSRFEINKNNVFTTTAMLAAYMKSEAWLDQVIGYLKENIDTLRDFLRQRIPSVRLVEPEGTFLVWLDFRALGLDVKQLANFLVQDARIAGNPGHWFGREGAGFARINIACPRKVMLAALERLAKAVAGLG